MVGWGRVTIERARGFPPRCFSLGHRERDTVGCEGGAIDCRPEICPTVFLVHVRGGALAERRVQVTPLADRLWGTIALRGFGVGNETVIR